MAGVVDSADANALGEFFAGLSDDNRKKIEAAIKKPKRSAEDIVKAMDIGEFQLMGAQDTRVSDFSHAPGLMIQWCYQGQPEKNNESSKYELMGQLGPLMGKLKMDPDEPNPVAKGMGLYTDKAYFLPGNRIMQEFSLGYGGKDKSGYKIYGFAIFGYTGLPARCPGDGLPPTSGYQIIADVFCIPEGDTGKPANFVWAKGEAKKYFNSQKDLRMTCGNVLD